jgi:hypothetical protein
MTVLPSPASALAISMRPTWVRGPHPHRVIRGRVGAHDGWRDDRRTRSWSAGTTLVGACHAEASDCMVGESVPVAEAGDSRSPTPRGTHQGRGWGTHQGRDQGTPTGTDPGKSRGTEKSLPSGQADRSKLHYRASR